MKCCEIGCLNTAIITARIHLYTSIDGYRAGVANTPPFVCAEHATPAAGRDLLAAKKQELEKRFKADGKPAPNWTRSYVAWRRA